LGECEWVFLIFLNEIFDDEYKVIPIKDGSNKYEIRAKLLYSFPE
jgi:predicted class III extradiol MEMO1 family dioxygenase